MNRGAVIRFAVSLLIAIAAAAAMAQNTLEIIALRHRTAEQLIPALQPLLDQGATLSGQGPQLFVRTSPANLAELRRALDSLDRPQKRLLISVRFDQTVDSVSRGIDAGRMRAEDSRTRAEERVDQRVQALDGARAIILTGESRPVRQRQFIQTPAGVISQEVTAVQETTSGFEVLPRVSGNTVQVEIAQQRPGSAAATAASGRLGEWFELGSVAMTAARDDRGIGSASRASGGETRRVWIRVDEVP
jgi:type II secretory pathway component GspD/PulD (secretin)